MSALPPKADIRSKSSKGEEEIRRDKGAGWDIKYPSQCTGTKATPARWHSTSPKGKSHDQRERRPGSSGVQAVASARRSRCWGRSGGFVSDHIPSGGGEDGTASGWISRHAKGASAM